MGPKRVTLTLTQMGAVSMSRPQVIESPQPRESLVGCQTGGSCHEGVYTLHSE